MGLYRRLFKGASSRDDVAPRSPEEARASEDLSDEIRALKAEIIKLREAIEIGGPPRRSERGRRGGRSRGSGDSSPPRQGGSFSTRGQREGVPRTPPDDAPVGLLVDYLKKHQVMVFEGQDDLGRNEAFEHLARHIGQHFEILATFYEKLKRCVASGRTSRIEIESYSEAERSAAVQLGTLLYRHGMLKDFYYHRSPKKQLRVIPNKDGEIQQFLTGGWLEIYVVWLLTRRLKAWMSPAKYQVLYNVKGTLPSGDEFEADLMAAIDGRLFWLECKTGQWQDYSARFRGLVKTFGTDRSGAGLVLIKPPDPSTRQRATDMLDMTLLSLSEIEDFVDAFLSVPADQRLPHQHKALEELEKSTRSTDRSGDRSGRGRSESRASGQGGSGSGRGRRRTERQPKSDATSPLPLRVVPPLSDEEIPLEYAEPAKKLGRVELDGQEDEIPRRRRRRRGGRGRGRGRPREEANGLREELPIQPIVDHQPVNDQASAVESSVESTSADKPSIPASMLAPVVKEAASSIEDQNSAAKPDSAFAESTDGPSRSRRRRSSRSRRPEDAAAESSRVPESESQAVRKAAPKTEAAASEDSKPREAARERQDSPAKTSPKGVTIAPDLSAMMATPRATPTAKKTTAEKTTRKKVVRKRKTKATPKAPQSTEESASES